MVYVLSVEIFNLYQEDENEKNPNKKGWRPRVIQLPVAAYDGVQVDIDDERHVKFIVDIMPIATHFYRKDKIICYYFSGFHNINDLQKHIKLEYDGFMKNV